ncbi:hypothetical protein BRADI_1g76413v3 [Brachypodium distachyon]|uniref:Uncharacterized protein n=1 Tax=Brachypodium distachyon TaxID=15368 RepID=A0A2K2DVF9_BRADI|nr:hypothetical protein BRADI_1g76413v3 [Brachypodium distachyon]
MGDGESETETWNRSTVKPVSGSLTSVGAERREALVCRLSSRSRSTFTMASRACANADLEEYSSGPKAPKRGPLVVESPREIGPRALGNLATYLPGRGRRPIMKGRGLDQWLTLHWVRALVYHLPKWESGRHNLW